MFTFDFRLSTFAFLLGAALVAGGAAAQTFPAKTVRLILPFPPGGPTDLQGRTIAQKLSEQVGQQVVADNRPGAGGNVGLELASKSPPDGHTLVLTSSVIASAPSLYAKLNYKQSDLAPVSLVSEIKNILLVHPAVPAKTPRDIVVKLNQEIVKALAAPEVKERLASLGADIVASSPEQTAAIFKADIAKYTKVAQAANIRAD